MRHTRSDVVRTALAVLDDYGLADLTMRRLAAELGVRPSALYHHVADKQTLLALVADEVLARGLRPADDGDGRWDDQVAATCAALREALLAYRDGAEVVATAHAFGLGATAPAADLERRLVGAGLDAGLARTAARTLLHYVLGHVGEEQTRLQARAAGAIEGAPDVAPREGSDFADGLGLVLDGLRHRVATSRARGSRFSSSPR